MRGAASHCQPALDFVQGSQPWKDRPRDPPEAVISRPQFASQPFSEGDVLGVVGPRLTEPVGECKGASGVGRLVPLYRNQIRECRM